MPVQGPCIHCWASDPLFLPLGPNGLFFFYYSYSQFLVALIIGLFFSLGFPQMTLNKDLEGLDEKRERALERSHKYRQKMTEAYGKMTKERVFAEGQLVLKVANYVRRQTMSGKV